MAERSDSVPLTEFKPVYAQPPKENFRAKLRRTIVRHTSRQESSEDEIRAEIQKFVCAKGTHRTCIKYVRDPLKDGSVCCCGREVKWHTDQGLVLQAAAPPMQGSSVDTTDGKPETTDPQEEAEGEKWTVEECTEKTEPTCYGTIKFQGQEDQLKPYIRVDYGDNIDNLDMVWELMYKYWQVPPPSLIISVTGGAKKFTLKSSLKRHFKRGLINAAATTGAWLITGGTDAGVMGFVGEAVKDYRTTLSASSQPIVALGIATWGVIDNKEALIGSSKFGQFPTYYETKSPDKSGATALDPNHTHFILVDDGTEGLFGKEIAFRTAFEQYLSRKMETGVAIKQSVNIPVVLLVCEGGPNTLKTALSAVEKGTPLVIMEGSGRAADYIVKAMKETHPNAEGEGTEFPEGFDESFRTLAGEVFDFENRSEQYIEKVLDQVVPEVRNLLSHRHMITIFTFDDSDSTDEIDQAILDALLTARRSNLCTQLSIALAWNRCDIAAQKILTSANLKTLQKDKDFLYEAMFTALVQERVDFVQLFMDSGVELKTFLTQRRLHQLYNTVVVENESPNGSADLIKHLLQQTKVGTTCCHRKAGDIDPASLLLDRVGRIISLLLGGQHSNIYKDFHVSVGAGDSGRNSVKMTRDSSGDNNMDKSLLDGDDRDCEGELSMFDSPSKHLFIWAVLLNRRELAHIFWRLTDNHIGGALIASALLKALAQRAENVETDLSEDIAEHADIFERHAVGVLGECYLKDQDLSHQLLVRKIEFWDNLTLFAVADSANHMTFMGHSCSQTKLNKMWKGRMAVYTGIWKIVCGLICPLWIFWIKFNTVPMTKVDKKKLALSEEFVQSRRGGRKDKVVGEKLYSVSLCGKAAQSTRSIGFIRALVYFYTSPLVKFCMNVVSMVMFLLLYSYVVLVDLRPLDDITTVSAAEWVLWAWELTLIIEEFRQILTRDAMSIPYKFLAYFSSIWNRFDQFINFAFLVSVVLRLTLPHDSFLWARISYCLTLSMFFFRFMHVFFVARNIGPKVIMIRRMLTDLMFFVLIFAVFLLAYGIAAQGLRFPNTDLSWSLFIDVIYMPYWQMYGELFLEDLAGDVGECTTNQTLVTPELPRCPQESSLVIFLFSMYMVMTNVLLLNLLIAMFSYTFEQVQENSETVWKFFRYNLIHEYNDRPTLPPPLIAFNHLYRTAKYLLRCCLDMPASGKGFKVGLPFEVNKKLTTFERVGMENYVHKTRIQYNGESSRGRERSGNYATHDDIGEVYATLTELQEQLRQHTELMNETLDSLQGLKAPTVKLGPLQF